jgi:hypothetical protein
MGKESDIIDTRLLNMIPQGASDVTYLIDVVGFGVIMAVCWWSFCLIVRNGIDGTKAVVRAIKHKKPLQVGVILIGKWKPMRDYEPVKPYQPGIEDIWKSM